MNTFMGGLTALVAPLFLVVAGILTLLYDVARPGSAFKKLAQPVSFVGVLLAGILSVVQLGMLGRTVRLSTEASVYFGGGIALDGFGAGINLIIAVAALLSLWMAGRYLSEKGLRVGEFYALVLFAAAGAMIMALSADLVNVFVGLEVLSVALYILAGFARRDRRSEESAAKYFLLGAFASGFLLYGIALIYGAVGMTAMRLRLHLGESYTSFAAIGEALQASAGSAMPLAGMPLFIAGVALLLVGLGFKAALAPFHSYAPDVYEGAPAPVAAFMSAAAKLGAFAALVRLLIPVLGAGGPAVVNNIVWVLAALTILIGNVMAVRQTSIKRMLAYSSIAHAGYVLVGVLASSAKGGALAADGVLFYLFGYTLMNLGAFAVVLWLGGRGEEFTDISRFAGLGRRHPGAAAVLTIFLLSLAGIPPTVGFLGKLYLFVGAMKAGYPGLAALAILLSALGLFYYLNLVVKMYFHEGTGELEPVRGDARTAALVAAVLTLFFGLFPAALLSPQASLKAPALPPAAASHAPSAH